MTSLAKPVDKRPVLPPTEVSKLLGLYDELTAVYASSAFVMQAMAAALVNGGGLDERSATGAVFCVQGLNDRTVELERRLKNIVAQGYQ